MRPLSKSKLLAFRQCPKRLWLELHQPTLRADSAATQASFDIGHQVGEIAQALYDPKSRGELIDPQAEGFEAAFSRSMTLLGTNQPIFEAGFRAQGALAFADVMLPTKKGNTRAWRMVEVKSSTGVKDYHRDDAAIQAFVAKSAGVPLAGISLAHIDSKWVYPGQQDYQGLLVEIDLTDDAFGRSNEVLGWITDAQTVARKRSAPKIGTGKHCVEPYECGFLGHCQSAESPVVHPIAWLPGALSKGLRAHIHESGLTDISEIPDGLLNLRQRLVKTATLSGKTYFDKSGAAQALAPHKLPAYFMDFETIQFAVPIWKGTRPYQQIPFQFSVHRLSRTGKIEHQELLDLSGNDPSKSFAEALIAACGARGPIFVYNAGFEKARINELAARFTRLAKPLSAINARVVDLLPVAREYYYHPSQKGSWSIKNVLKAACPALSHDDLDGVQDGGMAMAAFLEALSPQTSTRRKTEIEKQLKAYCALDTYAMVRLWAVFSGNTLNQQNG